MSDNKSKTSAGRPKRGRPSKKSKGLGDSVAKVTKATGIKKLAEWYTEITGKDCGCDKRQDFLNKLVPYHKHPTNREPKCLTESQARFIESLEIVETDNGKVTFKGNPSSVMITNVYKDVTGNRKADHPTCKCYATIVKQVGRVQELKRILHVCQNTKE